jgi:hypothetical protein
MLLGVVALVIISFPRMMSYHDSKTRSVLLGMVGRELPHHASMAQMGEFMRRHTARFALDQDDQLRYAGFMPQSRLDRFLADRKVQIILEINKTNRTFENADVRVYYTGP